MLNLNSIMLGTEDPKKLVDFYEKVLEKSPDMQDGSWYGWKVGDCFLYIGQHSEVKGKTSEPQRIILNFETEKVKEEFDRIKGIAEVIKEPYEMGGMWIATLADPDGNYFQLATPWKG